MKTHFGSICRIVSLSLILALLLGTTAHYWITDRLGVLRLLYHIEAPIHRASLSCSNAAPTWMRSHLQWESREGGGLRSQIAYLGPKGELPNCKAGWLGIPMLSEAVGESTRFRVASLTKVVTAATILRFAEDKKIDINDRLVDYLPELGDLVDPRVADIRLYDLLTHRGGFDRLKTSDAVSVIGQRSWCPYEPELLAQQRLDFDPGSEYSYSNLGYCLLGVVIERVSGMPFAQAVSEQLALEAFNIEFVDGPYLPDEVTYDFRFDDFWGENYHQLIDLNALASSAGLVGSARDVARLFWEISQRDGSYELLGADVSNLCQDGDDQCYGYAVYAHSPPRGDFGAHIQGGVLPGADALAVFDQYGGVTVLTVAATPPNRVVHRKAREAKLVAAIEDYYRSVPAEDH